MQRISASALTIGVLAIANPHGAVPQTIAPATSAAAATPAAPQTLQPGLADLMTMLVAPRHLKLYYAGTARNWELASFELRELRAAFGRIASVMPGYQDQNIQETVAALIEPTLQVTESAISAGDAAQFTRAYAGLTAACNGCHVYLEHQFLVIKVPESPARTAYPAQEFKSVP